MDKLERLINLLETHPMIEEGIRLKRIIQAHPEWIKDYQTMLSLQKRLVRETVDRSNRAQHTKSEIDRLLQTLESTPAVQMYLDALSELQEDFAVVQQILNQELNRQ